MKPSPLQDLTPGRRFRLIIDAAVKAGTDVSQQVLQLTYGDAAKLKRDPAIGDEEISFNDGVMSFLGVRVVEGATTSALADAGGIIILPDPAKAEVTTMAKGQKKSNKEIRKPKAEKPKSAPPPRTFTAPPSKSR